LRSSSQSSARKNNAPKVELLHHLRVLEPDASGLDTAKNKAALRRTTFRSLAMFGVDAK
jgi:hypothetical protein